MRKYSFLILTLFLFFQNPLQAYQLKKLVDLEPSVQVQKYLGRWKNNLIVQEPYNVYQLNKSQNAWEKLGTNLYSSSYLSFLPPHLTDLYASSNGKILRFDLKEKSWKRLENDSNLDVSIITYSGGKIVLLAGSEVYYLEKDLIKILPNKGEAISGDFHYWGASEKILARGGKGKVWIYLHSSQAWKDISPSFVKEGDDFYDIQAVDDAVYISLKQGGVYQYSLAKPEWTAINNGIPANEKIKNFNLPFQEIMGFSDKNQYRFDTKQQKWFPLNVGLENNFVTSLYKQGDAYFATNGSQIYRAKNGKKEILHTGLSKEGASFSSLEKSSAHFILYNPAHASLHFYNLENKQWVDIEAPTSSVCNEKQYFSPVLTSTSSGEIITGTFSPEVFSLNDSKLSEIKSLGNIKPKAQVYDCNLKDYPVDIAEVKGKVYLASSTALYEKTAGNTWQKIWSPASKTGEILGQIVTFDNQALLFTTQKAYKIEAKQLKAFPFIQTQNAIQYSQAGGAPYYTQVVSSNNELTILAADKIYLYKKESKKWEFIPAETSGIGKILYHQNQLLALKKNKLLSLNPKTQDFEEVLTWEKENIARDIIEKEGKLYLLTSNGIYGVE